jgi:hypothetical protein
VFPLIFVILSLLQLGTSYPIVTFNCSQSIGDRPTITMSTKPDCQWLQMKLREIAIQIQIDSRKLTDYALNPDNPVGRDKAFIFRQHLGFTQANYERLLQQIQSKAPEAEALFQRTDEHGDRYRIDLDIIGIEEGQRETVRTGWLLEPNSGIAKLITLYVTRKSS